MDDTQPPTQRPRHDTPGKIVQGHQAIGQLHCAQGRFGIALQVAVNVSAAQLQHQRPLRIPFLEGNDRAGTAPGMHGHHEVGGMAVIVLGDPDAVTQPAQDPGPARRGHAVTGA